MAQERKLKQAVVFGIKAIGFTLREQGVIDSPNQIPDKEIELILGPDDFPDKEDYYTIANIITNAVRLKATNLIEEGRENELNTKTAK